MDFKINDRVRIVSAKFPSVWYSTKLGETFVIDGFGHNQYGGYCMGHDFRDGIYECDIELVKEGKEEMQFDMKGFDLKTTPWFIRVANEQEFNAARDWVESLGFKFEYGNKYERGIVAISNYLNSRGEVEPIIHRNRVEDDQSEYHEIKLNFKTVIDSITFPEVKTEQQKQIEELEKTILLAQQQIETLKKGE